MLLEIVVSLLFILYVVLPLAFRYSAGFQRLAIFLPWSNGLGWPIRVDFVRPELLGLEGVRSCHLETDPGIKIGFWHILPRSLVGKVSANKPMETTLAEGQPIVLYLHGNSGSRAHPAHRLELYKLFQALDYHIITIDYRGFADSTNAVLSEKGAVKDALEAYRYIRRFSENVPVVVWGHSIGSGVAASLASQLCWIQHPPDGLVLESPFNSIRDELRNHPFAYIYRPLSVIDGFFTNNLLLNDLAFDSDLHVKRIECPILMIHAKDDVIVKVSLFEKLYEAAVKDRPSHWGRVECVQFRDEFHYGHENIYKAPELPSIIMEFFGTNRSSNNGRRYSSSAMTAQQNHPRRLLI